MKMNSDMEENTYFKNIVMDAVDELKKHGKAYVFYQEQVNAIKEIIKKNINVEYDGDFYILTMGKVAITEDE